MRQIQVLWIGCALWAVAALGASSVCSGQVGPDVIVGDLSAVANWGTDAGSGIYAYSIGTTSCNAGDEELLWISSTNQHPVIGQSIYRYMDGKFEHLGQSWLKHGFFALQGGLCGSCSPSSTGGSALGVGCSDPYTAGRNGSQGNLGPKSEVNAATGFFSYPPSNPPYSGQIGRRVQVHESDLDPALNPGAQYYGEAQYVAPDDALAGNGANNASWRPLNFDSSDYDMSTTSSTRREDPAIYAWQEIDPMVTILASDIPGDGRVLLGYRVTDNGDGTWHYEYAVHNINSHRSIRSFSLPLDSSVGLGSVDFNDVDYHSNEPYSGTDWSFNNTGSVASWSTDTFATNQNANAIRWGTLYNFRFDANTPPQSDTITLGLFRPGTPSTVSFTAMVPSPGGGLAGPTGLSCTELNSDVSLSWTNGDSYDSIQITREGTVVATLPGSATSYDESGVPVGTYTYLVRGFSSGDASPSAFCALDVLGLPAPQNLTCSETGGDVSLSWTNSFGYDQVRVRRDGTQIALLSGSATSYMDTGLSNGSYEYSITGIEGGSESTPTECQVFVFGGPSSGLVLVWDGPGAAGSDGVAAALTALGFTVITTSNLGSEALATYDAVFCCLGIFPNNHQMSDPEGTQLSTYITAGGRVYIEGGDIWGYDSETALDAVDGINGTADGSSDLFNIIGRDAGNGANLSSMGSLTYSGENNWIDHLSPDESASGVIWDNDDNSDQVGIAYLPGTQGPVIGCSFQFEGIGNATDQQTVMQIYVDVFGIGQTPITPVSALSCQVTGGDVDLDWTNGESYDNVRVERNGTQIALLAGSATSYTDDPGAGMHSYAVYGVVGGEDSASTTCSVGVTPIAPFAMSCTGGVGVANLSWTNGDTYGSVVVRRDGSVIATLAGSATSYSHNPAPAGDANYSVEGLVDGLVSLTDGCSTSVTPGAPTGLSCVTNSSGVDLVWSNPQTFDSISVTRNGAVIATLGGGATSYSDAIITAGSYTYQVTGEVDGIDSASAGCSVDVIQGGFVRGEVNGDGSVNLADAVTLAIYLFESGAEPSCLDGCDTNDDGQLNLADVTSLLDFVFMGGSNPAAPFPACGVDPTSDALSCGTTCP